MYPFIDWNSVATFMVCELHETIEKIMIELQEKFGITTGDVEPMLALKFDESVGQLGKIATQILERQAFDEHQWVLNAKHNTEENF